ncbi:MAG: PolC-type DNA polymerase III [Defluviitaleaceae bacterium]|nr:PolC-type DNA polymerase III [Defluviitaleaceae bacterium]
MKLVDKKLFDVFKMLLPGTTSDALKTAAVRNIRINNHEKKMEIFIMPEEVITGGQFLALEGALALELGMIENIDIIAIYSLEGDNVAQLEFFWENLLHRLYKASPFISQLVAGAKWQLYGNILRFDVPNDMEMLLRKMDAARQIEKILSVGINMQVRVEFVCAKEPKKQVDDLYVKPIAMTKSVEAKPRPKKTTATRVSGEARPLSGNFFQDETVVVQGRIFRLDKRETKSKKLLYTFDITDGDGSITVKMFLSPDKKAEYAALLTDGAAIKVAGQVQFDTYNNELNIMANKLGVAELDEEERIDDAPKKRVELHLHTNMSQLDGLTPAEDFIKRAAAWGHPAVAITDHGVVQAFPEAMNAAKKAGIKVIYGMEAYLVDDTALSIVTRPGDALLTDDMVIFDVETTGFDRKNCAIIEIGAVKLQGGQIVDRFSALIDPGVPLPEKIVELTRITDDMLTGQPAIDAVLPLFLDFIGDAVLVAHNADFDMGFLEHNAKMLGREVKNPYICTLQLSRALFPDLARHGLAAMVKHHGITLENHHRACDDAEALAGIFMQQVDILKSQQITELNYINIRYSKKIDVKKLRPHHAIILVKNRQGLRNLYELVSKSHMDYFARQPRIPKSEFLCHRDGLIIGTACERGEFFSAILENRPEEHIETLAEFYDYFEIQPTSNNAHLVKKAIVENIERIQEINKKIVEYGELHGKLVVATGDAHYLDPGQEVYRTIIMAGNGFDDAESQPPLYFMTTEEMLANFAYLGEEDAHRVVVENTNLIADMVENFPALPEGSFPPTMEGAGEDLVQIVTDRARAIYGDPLPEEVATRMDRELASIIGNNFAVMYIIARKLVVNSVENGYLVGSRGSIGSSFVATMADITEVNPLSPHYFCPNCQFTDFDSDIVRKYAGASGCDMPDRGCPNCDTKLKKDGHSIPFETFLGFDGDKEPDIDLNFSGEYQAKAHAYAEELFGEGYVFKAGTISTIADKTAFGYVKKYLEERGRAERNAEINRLSTGCTGIKRTTGQHPGGLMVVPRDRSIYEFTPVQRPANDVNSDVTTTHFDYHSLGGRLMKLDILGHDVPTIIRMLHDMTGLDPRQVDIADKDVVALFSGPEKLGVSEKDINCRTGSLGLPEFGTHFVRQMLVDTRPSSFAELVRISGLSHGTNVWTNNGADLIRKKIATLKEIIPTRDDIMVYLILKGVAKLDAFKIMENVRRGKGVTDEEERVMLGAGVPRWYIESCRKISYMFPKGHAVAYVMMTMRIGYYKIHHPAAFYAATFSVKSDDFDYEVMCKGPDAARAEMRRINTLGNDATQKDEKAMVLLELVNEMYARGLTFAKLDLYQASADKFLLTEEGLMPPLCAVAGLGAAAAETIVIAREDGEFFSVEDFKTRTKVNKNVIQLLKDNGVLDGMPETEQLALF